MIKAILVGINTHRRAVETGSSVVRICDFFFH